jgi:hypothetical protein
MNSLQRIERSAYQPNDHPHGSNRFQEQLHLKTQNIITALRIAVGIGSGKGLHSIGEAKGRCQAP